MSGNGMCGRVLVAGLALATALPVGAQDFSTAPIEGFGTIGGAADGWGGAGAGVAEAQVVGTGFTGLPAAQGPAGGRPDFRLFRGTEAALTFGFGAAAPGGGDLPVVGFDTRTTFGLAPFLGAQADLGAALIDFDETAVVAGFHLFLTPEGGDRFGVFWLPLWESGSDGRMDNYGIEGMFGAIEGLSVEVRGGRFDGDAASGPYFGARGAFGIGPATAVTAEFQHSRLDVAAGAINGTEALIGAEYTLPGTEIMLGGGVGLSRFAGDVPTQTDLRVEIGATIFAFGAEPGPARLRPFGRQRLFGAF